MKWFLLLWAGPVALLMAWYFLSLNDMNFGIFMLTRQAHDMVFDIYGGILGIDPVLLPPMVMRAIALDTLIVAGLFAFRRRRVVAAWFSARCGDEERAPEELSVNDNHAVAPPPALTSKL